MASRFLSLLRFQSLAPTCRSFPQMALSLCGWALWALLFTAVSLLASPANSSAQDKEAAAPNDQAAVRDFIRIRKDAGGKKPLSLETCIARYTKKGADGKPIVVDLIGVVHIGEKEYYEALNDKFQSYDALLYELVAPEGTRVPAGGREADGSPISGLQNGMKDMLGLEFQLDHIDYQKDNFVHADMSPEEFVESMTQNEESFAKMFFKMIGSSLAAQGSTSFDQTDIFLAMVSSDRQTKLRRAMAQQMASAELAMVAFSGKDGSTIIHHRNGKCFEVMDKVLAAGKKELGIFYGAGHLQDMEERLLKRGFALAAPPQWYVAWRLTREPLETIVVEPAPQEEASPSDIAPDQPTAPQSSDLKGTEQPQPEASGDPAAPARCPTCPPHRRGRLFPWRR